MRRCKRLLGAVRICEAVGTAHAVLEGGEVVSVDIPVAVEIGEPAARGIGLPRTAQAQLEPPKVLLIHVAVAVEIARNGWRTTGGIDGRPGSTVRARVAYIPDAITIRVLLGSIRHQWAVVARISQTVGVAVFLVWVRVTPAVVAGVAHAVAVTVRRRVHGHG